MAFQRPSLAELIARTTADLVSRLTLAGEPLRRAFVRVLAKVWSGVAHGLHGHLDWAARQFFAAEADESELIKHGGEIGVARIGAEFAEGPYTFTGSNGTEVPAGTRLQRSDGVEYLTLALVTIAGGTATATVRAVVAADLANAASGTQLLLVSPIAGVQTAGVVAAGGLVDGRDLEAVESWRARILDRKRRPPQGGADADYQRWTQEVVGSTRVWVLRHWMGLGTLGVMFVVDGEVQIIPDAPTLAEVQAYIDERRPVTAEVFVFAPTPVTVNFEIALQPNTVAVQGAVEAELDDLLRRIEPSSTTQLSQFSEAIAIAAGEISHVLQLPAAPLVLANNQVPVLGTITWL